MNERIEVTRGLSQRIGRMLVHAGFSPHISGFAMMCEAVERMMEDGGVRDCKITGELYPEIAELFGTSKYAVERDIRTAITKAWSSGALKRFYGGLGIFAEQRPSNAACIAQLTYALASGMADEQGRAAAN